MVKRVKISDEELQKLIKERCLYDSETGFVTWKEPEKYRVKHQQGQAGWVQTIGKRKYRTMVIKYRSIMAHRIAWFLYHNEWPTKEIDHIDGDGLNNKINNLRHVSKRENALNKDVHRSGRLFGCCFNKESKKWQAAIRIDGKKIMLGTFNTEIEAHQKYVEVYKRITNERTL
jgi:hypothetical protein